MANEPIIPQDYLGGVTVVDIGDLRVARGLTRRPVSTCTHRQMRYDPKERRVWCSDCEQDIDSFDAFTALVEGYDRALKDLTERRARLLEAEQFQVRSLAAKEIDKAWRSRNMVPACPHCRQGLFPEDFKDGVRASLGRDYAEAQRRKRDGARS